MNNRDHQNPDDFVTQNGSAKSEIVNKIARIVRREGLDYDDWRYVSKRVREKCELRPKKKPVKLPRIMTAAGFRKFFQEVDRSGDAQHALMMRLLFYTATRVSELCSIRIDDIDLENNKINIVQGKGSKDRVVLFDKSFAVALRTHISSNPKNRFLFQTRRRNKFTTRRVQQIVKLYSERAELEVTPHTLRHQSLTLMTKAGMSDAEIQLLSGHAQRNTLQIYQHLAVDGQVAENYQEAMNRSGLDR